MKNIKIILLIVFSLSASAEVINQKGVWGCTTDSKDTELNNAIKNNDKMAMDYLLSNGCIILEKGQHISVIRKGETIYSPVKVRVYPKNRRPMEIWLQPSYYD